MAKPKESTMFEEPEFDEKEFFLIERDRAIGIIVIFVIGALSGLLAGYLQLQGYSYLSVLLMLGILVLLTRILKVMRIKVSTRTSHRIINYGMYIFTWLLFWIIVLNPPISVVSSPQIHTFQVEQTTSGVTSWTNLSISSTGDYQGLTGTHSYSIHLTYKYNFSVPSNGFYYIQNNNKHLDVSHSFSNGYLNFSLTGSVSTPNTYYIQWSSSASNNRHPLEFTITYQ